MPFAIIAEEKNEYTALFDDVIITNEATRSFCDKFLLLKLCPYDETIFLDADCLAYGDLNLWWKEFEGATDFSAPGANVYPPFSENDGSWYEVEKIGKYGEKLTYKCQMHAGVIFLRKGSNLLKMYKDCIDLYTHFSELQFHTCPNSIDECVFGVAMPMNKMKAITEKIELLAAYPCLIELKTDILNGKIATTTTWGTSTESGKLIHWGTIQTYQPLYRFEVKCLQYMLNGKKNLGGFLLYDKKGYYFVEILRYSIVSLWKRVHNKVKSFLQ